MKLVVFDCDGTLVDSQNAISVAMRETFQSEGLEWPGRAATLSIVGLSLIEAMRALRPGDEDARHRRMADAYKQAFHRLRLSREHEEPLYDGTREVLDLLRARDDVILGIATGKSQRGVRALLEREALEHHFATIQTADDAPSKPHPGMLLQAMAETGAGPAGTVMIGDTSFDMAMARAAGTGAVGVDWGYHGKDHLLASGAQVLLSHFSELPAVLESIWEAGE